MALLGLGLLAFNLELRLYAAESKQVTLAPNYGAGWFHRLWLGDHWRDLWTTSIPFPVLDLKTFAGGLKPLQRGGGMQTQGLRFAAPDGRQYKFRSINKDPIKTLPPELRDSLLAEITQDQISSGNPVAPLIVAPFAKALGVFETTPQLVILPDDPAMGEFREDFKNVAGTIEESPTDSEESEGTFEGVDKIINTLKLFKKMESDSKTRVDDRAYLRARLLDIFLGDWDRHHKQWKWGRIDRNEGKTQKNDRESNDPARPVWQPIAKDRDQAFSKLDGILPWLSTRKLRQLNSVEETYPRIEALTWSGRIVDRRILSQLSRANWEEETRQVIKILTDKLITQAVHQMPREMWVKAGPDLERLLRSRRDRLSQASQDFYKLLAAYPDVRGTDRDDKFLVESAGAGRVRVRIYTRKHDRLYFDRTFDPHETNQIRIFHLDGADEILIPPHLESSIQVRVFSGDENGVRSTLPPAARFDIPLDYGYDWWFQPLFSANSYEGLLLGGGPILSKHDVAQYPYVYSMQLRGGYAIGVNRFMIDFAGDFYSALKPLRLLLDATVSKFKTQNFYGIGNETGNSSPAPNAYAVNLRYYSVNPHLEYPNRGPWSVGVGLQYEINSLSLDSSRFVAASLPYGVEVDQLVGFQAYFHLDTRDSKAFATRGSYVDLRVTQYPGWLNNPTAFQKLDINLSQELSLHYGTDFTLGLHAQGGKVFSRAPFYQLPTLGGMTSLRGLPPGRFTGEMMLAGSVELRAFLTRFNFLFPAKLGVFGFTDWGKVYTAGEISDLIHNGYGGGFYSTFVSNDATLTGTYAQAEGSSTISLGVGFAY